MTRHQLSRRLWLLLALLLLLSQGVVATRANAATDSAPPVLRVVRPVENGVTEDVHASVTLYYYDPGSGVDPASLRFRVDQRDVTPSIKRSDTLFIYLPAAPWTGGEHRIQVELSDMAGNRAELSWRFYVKSAVRGVRIGGYTLGGQLKSELIWSQDWSLNEALALNFSDAPGGVEVAGRVNASVKRSAVPDRSWPLIDDYWANVDSFWLEASRPKWRVEAGDVTPVTGHEMTFGPGVVPGLRAGAAIGSNGWIYAGRAGESAYAALFDDITALQADWTKGTTEYGIAGAELNGGQSQVVDVHVGKSGDHTDLQVSGGTSTKSGQPGSSLMFKGAFNPGNARLQGAYQRTTADYVNDANPSLPLDKESLSLAAETQLGPVGLQGEVSRGRNNLGGEKQVTRVTDKAAAGVNLPEVAGWNSTLKAEGDRTTAMASGDLLAKRMMTEAYVGQSLALGGVLLELSAGLQHTDLTESETEGAAARLTSRDRVTGQGIATRGQWRVILDLEKVREELPFEIHGARVVEELTVQYGLSTDKSGVKVSYRHDNNESWSLEDSGAFVRVVRDKASLESWTALGPNRQLTAELSGDSSSNNLGRSSPWEWQARVGVTWVF